MGDPRVGWDEGWPGELKMWVVWPEPAVGDDRREMTVQKHSAYVPVSCCVLTDTTGVNHCKHPLPAAPSRRQRLRWAAADWWYRTRMRFGSWIAGVDLDRED